MSPRGSFTNGVPALAGGAPQSLWFPADDGPDSVAVSAPQMAQLGNSGLYTPVVVYADPTAADFTAPVAELTGGNKVCLVLTGALSGDATLTTPNVADLIAAQWGGVGELGQSWVLRLLNESSANHKWTLAGGPGVDVIGTATFGQGVWRDFAVQYSGVGALTVTNIGAGSV